ncbi:DUF3291 domain-containing protein [Spirosoma flavum]
MMHYHVAEINIAKMKGVTIDDPVINEFADNLDRVNALAENSAGFVWRLKDESNNATSARLMMSRSSSNGLSGRTWKALKPLRTKRFILIFETSKRAVSPVRQGVSGHVVGARRASAHCAGSG